MNVDGQITAVFLPANCTLLHQLMDQSVNQTIKLVCRKKVLLDIAAEENRTITTLKI
jgi:hypothetical protein